MAGARRQGTLAGSVAVAVVVAVAVATLALIAAPARALAPPSPWDGVNPFHCKVQQAGFGTTVPDPGADPYCVSFDKTRQNISQLGIAEFLLKEPARVAAASPKCFYFQEDHWRASVVQSDRRSVLYEFVGHYFFDKATGDGGVWVTRFSIAGQTFDPTMLPGFPPSYGRFFGPGTGGVITHDQIPADPSCVALAKRNPAAIYAAAANRPRCVPAAGRIDRHGVGPLTLGIRESQVRAALGPPQAVKRGFLRYCVTRGGALLDGEPGDRSGTRGSSGTARAVILLTTSRVFVLRGRDGRLVRAGSSRRALIEALPGARRLASIKGTAFVLADDLIAGIRAGHVVALGAYDGRAIRSKAALTGYLLRAA